MKTVKERCAIVHHSFLRFDGMAESDFPRDISPKYIRLWYRHMLLARLFDKRMLSMQKQGDMGTYASSEGQEAVGVGYASAMYDEDVLVVPYREYAAHMMRAGSVGEAMMSIMFYWGGDERGNSIEGCPHDFPMCVPIGTQAGHAVGTAMAMKLRGEPHAVVCVLGDGATSKGDVKAAMQWAMLWNLPLVFIVVNNQWAISVPRTKQSGAVTLAQIGFGEGIRHCCQVDGNDVVAVHEMTRRALIRARRGQGPSVIEAITYRLGNHTTADNAERYRSKEEVERASANDPLVRTRAYLIRKGALNDEEESALLNELREVVQRVAAEYLDARSEASQPATDIFDHLHAKLPEALNLQREKVACHHRKGGGHGH